MTTAVPAPEDPRLLKLRGGEPLEFPALPDGKEETPEEQEARTIPASWLEDLAANHARVVAVPINISQAVIAGPLDLHYATFEAELSITDSRFTDEADFSFATFNRSATFRGSRFKKAANFRASRAHADFEIMGASFADTSSFQDLHVDEVLQASGATFGSVNFERIEVSKSAYFRTDDKGQRTTFGGEVRFLGAHIMGNADFSGAEFKGKASFDGIQVDGGAFFRTDDKGQRARFGGEVRFHSTHIKGPADFSGAEFTGRAAFDGLQVGGGAFFSTDAKDNRVTFGGEARFLGAHVGGQAVFGGAQFKGPVAFDGLQVDGDAFFSTDAKDNRTTFGAEASFLGAHVGGQASFRGAQFKGQASFFGIQIDGGAFFRTDDNDIRVTFGGPASFPSANFGADAQFSEAEFKAGADFDNAHFHGAADFTSAEFAQVKEQGETKIRKATFVGARFERGAYFNSAQFRGETDFTAAVAERDAHFPGAKFSGPSSFREAQFRVVSFRHTLEGTAPSNVSAQFGAGVDLRGFTYERILVAWRELLGKLSPYDRQPYTQLERALRDVGQDGEANKVYYERRWIEGERMKPWNSLGWYWDRPFRHLAGYGTRVWPLVVILLSLVLCAGPFVFSKDGAVREKPEASVSGAASLLQATNAPKLREKVSWFDAFAVGLHLLTGLEVPSGAKLVPSENLLVDRSVLGRRVRMRFSTYATFHRILGWLLIPIVIASLAERMRRRVTS